MQLRLAQWLIVSSLLLIAGFAAERLLSGGGDLRSAVLSTTKKLEVPWRSIDESEVLSGATIPADTNVVLHIPVEQTEIVREVLFGRQGKLIRYWGYCFPESGEPIVGNIFPGKIFLSEAERAVRDTRYRNSLTRLSVFELPRRSEIAAHESAPPETRIRHELEVFRGGWTCYVMAAKPLPVGVDLDLDGLNAKLELINGTDPLNADTDGDGVTDGGEVFGLKTLPTKRDSDGDGLIDGIEDKNRNGIHDQGETNPLEKDSDGDGLCDGFCRDGKQGRTCDEFAHTKSCTEKVKKPTWRGEDENLDGVLDAGETDPTKQDTDGDGIFDEQEYFNELLGG